MKVQNGIKLIFLENTFDKKTKREKNKITKITKSQKVIKLEKYDVRKSTLLPTSLMSFLHCTVRTKESADPFRRFRESGQCGFSMNWFHIRRIGSLVTAYEEIGIFSYQSFSQFCQTSGGSQFSGQPNLCY